MLGEIFYGVFWKNSSARFCASSWVAAHTVTMATSPTISRSKGTAPVNLNSSGTDTRTTNCFSSLMRFSTCLIVSVTFLPVLTCNAEFFNAGADQWPCIRCHQSRHGTVNKPFKLNHVTFSITAQLQCLLRYPLSCPVQISLLLHTKQMRLHPTFVHTNKSRRHRLCRHHCHSICNHPVCCYPQCCRLYAVCTVVFAGRRHATARLDVNTAVLHGHFGTGNGCH